MHIKIPIKYTDKIKYISKSGDKDEMGYTIEVEEDRLVRYVGGKEVQVPSNNGFGTEHRLIYFCPFEVKDGDKFVIDGNKMEVKQSTRVVDIFCKTVHWEVELK